MLTGPPPKFHETRDILRTRAIRQLQSLGYRVTLDTAS